MESLLWRGWSMSSSLPPLAVSSGPPPEFAPSSVSGTTPASGSSASLPTPADPTPSYSAPCGSHTVRAGSVGAVTGGPPSWLPNAHNTGSCQSPQGPAPLPKTKFPLQERRGKVQLTLSLRILGRGCGSWRPKRGTGNW